MRKRIIYAFMTLSFCLTATIAQAQEADFAEKLKTISAATQTIECDFTLTKTMSFMASDVVSEGRFYYMRSVGISLDFTKPSGDQITMGGDKFRIISSGKKAIVKMDSNPMLGQLKRMLTACMTGDIEMLKEGSVVSFADAGEEYVVTLKPNNRRAKKMMKLITLTFEKEYMSLTTLRMEEASGDVSLYRFFDKKFNENIDPAHFDI